MTIREQATEAAAAARKLAAVSPAIKNKALEAMADALLAEQEGILASNAKDMEAGKAKNMKASLLDRLLLTSARLADMADGLRQVAALKDPVGEIIGGSTLANGLTVTKIRVPLGVIGIIYEARPNVTADAIGLCLKSGNAVILKGGSEAIHSNTKIAAVLRAAAEDPVHHQYGPCGGAGADHPERAGGRGDSPGQRPSDPGRGRQRQCAGH